MSAAAEAWLVRYGAAWERRDPDAAAAIFTEDASYRRTPFVEPFVGREAIREYWGRAVSNVEEVRFRFGTPVVEGDRVAAEWWTTLRRDGEERTIAGEFLLRFVGDQVRELREYVVSEPGVREPHPSWGG